MLQNKLTLRFNPNFFQEEVREGYCVTTEQKKIWAVELDLLDQILRVCSKYDIKISAWAGTILGAVRHKGFIPWDDDLDVCLTRKEYEKLLKVATHEFKYPYFFQTALTDQKFFCPYARLRNSETTGAITWNYSPEYNNGIYIDVYVLDGYIDDSYKLKKQLRELHKIQRWIDCAFQNTKRHKATIRGKLGYLKFLLKYPITFLVKKMCDYENYLKNYTKIITRYEDEAQNIGLVTHGSELLRKYWCSKDDMEDLVFMPFEILDIPVPENHIKILKHMYGNFMEYPPVDKRGLWHDDIIIFDPDTGYKEFIQKHRHI